MTERAGKLWPEVLADIEARMARRLTLPPSPSGGRCWGCLEPAQPLVKCACGVMVYVSNPPTGGA